MKSKKSFTIYEMAAVGVMAAIIFVLTYFIKIPIPTPAGQTMLKLANAFCLLAGVLFGGLRGGIAAGLGSMLYDLLDPIYITSAPITFVRFFLMAFICGVICLNGKNLTTPRLIIGVTIGSVFSLVFYFFESVLRKTLETVGFGAELFTQTGLEAAEAAFVACVPKLVTSGINTIIGIVIATLLAYPLQAALKKAKFYEKTGINVKAIGVS